LSVDDPAELKNRPFSVMWHCGRM